MKTAVTNAFPLAEEERNLVKGINSTTILNKGKFGFNERSGTLDLMQTCAEEQDILKVFLLQARTKQ